ncbi:ThiF family adenylyltransferase [Alteribacter populi]|uniref:ThiF family adenylyltransferase n=1 Tax=Alteribacter populi TaxID=2011011 RepID=UPI000BBA65B8|nr:ThiF family adenylyltransferase [Alteribacter populi]
MRDDWNRYSRQVLFEPVGEKGQELLSEKKVFIVGMGALGTVLANHFVRAGVGHVAFADRDYVEKSNLQRQMLFDEADVESMLPKAAAAETKLKRFNSSIVITGHVTDVTAENAEELVMGADVVVDGTDNFETRFLINDVCFKHGIPFVYGGAVSSRGMQATFLPEKDSPCLRCVVSPGASTGQTCDTVGVLSPVVDLVASYQAMEAIKILTGNIDEIRETLASFDLWKNEQFNMKLRKKSECPTCGEKVFPSLSAQASKERISTLCGRDTVQIQSDQSFDLHNWAKRLEPVGEVKKTPFLVRVTIEDGERLVLFPDGRTLIQGTEDVTRAKSLFAKYIGM